MAAKVSGSLSIVDGIWVFRPTGQEMMAETISEMHRKGVSVASPEKPLEPDSGGTLELSLVEGPTMNSCHASATGTAEMEGVIPADFSGEPVCDEMKHEEGNPFTLTEALTTADPDRSKGHSHLVHHHLGSWVHGGGKGQWTYG